MAIAMNNHVFKGHKTLLGSKYVTYKELELPVRYDLFPKSKSGFDWGNSSLGSQQLAFSILFQLSNEKLAQENAEKFMEDVVKNLQNRDWVLSAAEVLRWIETNVKKSKSVPLKKKKLKAANNTTKEQKTNVVKEVCKELEITQKQLAEILEVPEGTVSSWAVKNEIPRLGKKAIEFYILSQKNQKIVDSYRSFMELLKAS
jgi:DNA-binding transcriptional regulator YiaG